LQVVQTLNADGFSRQPRHAVAPFVVQAFDHAGFTTAFFAGAVLLGFKEFGIRFIKVAINQLAAIPAVLGARF
jgi:hypothetical protein